MTQLFVAVEDLDGAIAAATRFGASIIVPKSILPDGDAMAVVLIPGGVPLGLCTLSCK